MTITKWGDVHEKRGHLVHPIVYPNEGWLDLKLCTNEEINGFFRDLFSFVTFLWRGKEK